MTLSESLLEISILLVAAVFIGIFARRVRIPVTVVLAVGGFLLAWAAGADALPLVESLYGEEFAETVVNVFLPILIFEATLNISTRDFLRNLGPILVLATVALAISAAFVGYSLYFILGIPLTSALLFGVLISATDPVAVLSVFKRLGVSKRLLTLVEGESLMNDGVAIVGYSVLLHVALGGSVGFAEGALELFTVFVGGAVIGSLIGLAAALVLPMLDRLSAATLSLGVAYGSFVFAHEVLDVSGVMATAAAGLILGALSPSRASEPVRNTVTSLWDALSYIANALLFLFVGLLISPALIGENIDAIVVAIIAVLIARPIAIYPVVTALERFAKIPKVGNRNASVLVWGGLRGGVALALALALPSSLILRELFIAMTGGVVLVTLLLNATTISTLVHRLGLDKPSRSEEFLEASARLLAIEDARKRLDQLGFHDKIVRSRLRVVKMEAKDQLNRIELSPNEELEVYTLRGLHVERQTYQVLSDAGLLRPIATRTLMQEIDDEIEEIKLSSLQVEAARRGARPWYARAVRGLLGWLPEPAGEDLTEVAYSEVSARRLAALRANDELDMFKRLPNCDTHTVDKAKETFAYWEQRAADSLHRLDEAGGVDKRILMRRQAEALTRVASVEAVRDLVDTGLLPDKVADHAVHAIVEEVDRTDK
ncbi:MAG: sodium:proton antiporter [Acidimicrobiia bacterium]|nr:sodium:proton antiporter [Acidimicrobiia bacterium]